MKKCEAPRTFYPSVEDLLGDRRCFVAFSNEITGDPRDEVGRRGREDAKGERAQTVVQRVCGVG